MDIFLYFLIGLLYLSLGMLFMIFLYMHLIDKSARTNSHYALPLVTIILWPILVVLLIIGLFISLPKLLNAGIKNTTKFYKDLRKEISEIKFK